MSVKQPLEICDMEQYRFLSGLQISPDGKNCVFAVHRMNLPENEYYHDLFLYSFETQSIRQLSTDGKSTNPFWLDNRKVIYSSSKESTPADNVWEKHTRYYLFDLDREEHSFFMDIPATVVSIAALAPGKFAVLAKSYIRDDISCVKLDSYCETWDYSDQDYIVGDELPFRQDGMGITNGMRHRCFVFDRNADELRPVSKPTQFIESFNVNDGKIIFSARNFSKNSAYLFYGDVEVYDERTGELSVLMDDNSYRVYGVGFIGNSPAFVGTRGLEHGYQNQNSSFYFFENGKPVCFCTNDRSTSNTVGTDVRYGRSNSYIFTPDGVYFVGTEGGNAFLKFASVEGRINCISHETGTIDDFDIVGKSAIYAGLHENRPEELYELNIYTGNARRVSDFNGRIVRTRVLSEPETISFDSAGQTLEGYIVKPCGFDETQHYPAILYIHGGHKCAFGPVYYHEMQVWANKGFFVVFCNPRGSDGRDDEFADVIGHYGFYEEEDLLNFRKECLRRFPQIDPERMGVGGGSYGGYLTNWMISRTHCFRCAVSQRSIASWNSMFLTSDTNYLFPCWSAESNSIWMDYEKYWEHSPMKYIDQCDTPTLFIHSDNDFRCPVSEGISMFHALQFNGIESRICIFKGESHGLSRGGKPRNRIKRLSEITLWFENHLK